MSASGPVLSWHRRDMADVPAGDDWLTGEEQAVLATLRIPKRRDDWRLGRFVAKELLGQLAGRRWTEIAVLAASDGAPEAYVGGRRLPWSLSISHRAGRGLAVAAVLPTLVGGDLEWVEPRSDAFVADWLAPAEQAAVSAAPERDRAIAMCWAAKEAVAKVLREGLRLDPRDLVVMRVDDGGDDGWQPTAVEIPGGSAVEGWVRVDGRLVVAIAARPAAAPSRSGPRK